jgi:hypothetical protein
MVDRGTTDRSRPQTKKPVFTGFFMSYSLKITSSSGLTAAESPFAAGFPPDQLGNSRLKQHVHLPRHSVRPDDKAVVGNPFRVAQYRED